MSVKSSHKESSYSSALGWSRTSEHQLHSSAAHLMSGVKSLEQEYYVDIGPVIDPAGDRILTVQANHSSPRTPLVLVHGLGCGSGLWCNNIDALAKDRPVYAFDLVGFGRSSRPNFSTDPVEIEEQYVATIEAWRIAMGLKKFYLCGHSFGGYLSTLYSMKYPSRVEHLILVDPWGFPARPPDYKLPMYLLPIELGSAFVLPLFVLRAAGPLGYLYLRIIPPFSTKNFCNVSNPRQFTSDYFYHVNVRNPSGERAFHTLMAGLAWAKRPIVLRLEGLRKEVPITFLYGEKTWVWKKTGSEVKEMRADSYVDVQIVAAAGHAIGSDQPAIFNAIVSRVLRSVDCGETPRNSLTDAHPGNDGSNPDEPGQSAASTSNHSDDGASYNTVSGQSEASGGHASSSTSHNDLGCDVPDCDTITFRDIQEDFEDRSSHCDSGLGSLEESPVTFDLGDADEFYDTSEDPTSESLADDIEERSFLSVRENDDAFVPQLQNDAASDSSRSLLTQIAELISPNSLDSNSMQAMDSRRYPSFILPTKLSGLYIDPKEAMTRLQHYMDVFLRRR